jgi:hypothetical protein
MNFNYILKIKRQLFKLILKREPKIILGRWNLDNCNKKTDRKIDLANEDHCGPCGNSFNKK